MHEQSKQKRVRAQSVMLLFQRNISHYIMKLAAENNCQVDGRVFGQLVCHGRCSCGVDYCDFVLHLEASHDGQLINSVLS